MKGWMWGLLIAGIGVTGFVVLSKPKHAFAAAPHNAPHYPVVGPSIPRFKTPAKGNTIFNRPFHTQNNHHQADNDPWGPDLMLRQKHNNLEVYGSCSIC